MMSRWRLGVPKVDEIPLTTWMVMPFAMMLSRKAAVLARIASLRLTGRLFWESTAADGASTAIWRERKKVSANLENKADRQMGALRLVIVS